MSNTVSVASLSSKFQKFEAPVKSRALRVLRLLKKNGAYAEIYLAPDNLMRRINRTRRGKDKVANILSFAEPKRMPHPELKNKTVLGEIYLNPGFVAEWLPGAGRRRSAVFSLDQFLSHGILHLLGYTHSRKSGRMTMENIEKKILRNTKKYENTKA